MLRDTPLTRKMLRLLDTPTPRNWRALVHLLDNWPNSDELVSTVAPHILPILEEGWPKLVRQAPEHWLSLEPESMRVALLGLTGTAPRPIKRAEETPRQVTEPKVLAPVVLQQAP